MPELADVLPIVDSARRARVGKLDKLNKTLQRALVANPIDLPELGGVTTAPTGSQVQITFPTAAPTGGRYYSATSGGAPNVDSWCNFYGTPKVYGGAADHVQCQTGTTSAATQAASANISQTVNGANNLTNGRGTMFGIEFMTDSLSPVIKMVAGGGSQYFRLIVDGQYVVKTPGPLTTIPANRFINLTFASRKLRRIKLEIEQDAAFDGVYVSALESIQKINPSQLVRAAMLLDSYGVTTVGSPPTPMWDGPMGVLAKLMGWDDVRNASIPGTGWVNPGTAWPFGSHLGDINVNPDVIVLGGCFNDNSYSASSISSVVASGLSAVRAANPNVPIIMLGVWTPPIATLSAELVAEAAQLAGYLQAADTLTAFIPLANRPSVTGVGTQPVFFGTGSDAALAGDGNADLYIKADKTHPNAAGYPYLARFLANDIRAALTSMTAQ